MRLVVAAASTRVRYPTGHESLMQVCNKQGHYLAMPISNANADNAGSR